MYVRVSEECSVKRQYEEEEEKWTDKFKTVKRKRSVGDAKQKER